MHEPEEKLLITANELSPVDFFSFMTERKVDINCPSCHQNAWQVLDHPKVGFAQVPLQGGSTPVNSMPTMVLICHNCGFVRSHSALLIAQWKIAKEVNNGGI